MLRTQVNQLTESIKQRKEIKKELMIQTDKVSKLIQEHRDKVNMSMPRRKQEMKILIKKIMQDMPEKYEGCGSQKDSEGLPVTQKGEYAGQHSQFSDI